MESSAYYWIGRLDKHKRTIKQCVIMHFPRRPTEWGNSWPDCSSALSSEKWGILGPVTKDGKPPPHFLSLKLPSDDVRQDGDINGTNRARWSWVQVYSQQKVRVWKIVRNLHGKNMAKIYKKYQIKYILFGIETSVTYTSAKAKIR